MTAKKSFQFLSSSWLKVIAITAMVIDHAAVIFIGEEPSIWRNIGRIAFPLFAFMIAQGAVKTKNRLKYALRLLAFAFISEVPFDWGLHGVVFETESQNVYFTLFLGLLSVIVLDYLLKKHLGFFALFTTVGFALGAFFLRSDYGFMGVVVITLMGLFCYSRSTTKYMGYALSALLTSVAFVPPLTVGFIPSQVYAVFSAVPLALYNGKRGFYVNKYFFYAFYPLHILLLAGIKTVLAG